MEQEGKRMTFVRLGGKIFLKYLYFDLNVDSGYLADSLFYRRKIPVRFKEEMARDGEKYRVIFCNVHRKYQKDFEAALEELTTKMCLFGNNDYEKPKGRFVQMEKDVDGYRGFLFLDEKGLPLVAMHWQHRFNHMVNRYNEIFKVQMPKITPHVCRHTYCSNMARNGMNPKTLQYLMGHSDISVTMNTYTHLGLEDAAAEMKRLEEVERAREEQERMDGPISRDEDEGMAI